MIKAPSFKGLRPASPSASAAKSKNKRIDTSHELLLRRELGRLGLKFRKHLSNLPGKPDIVFPSARVVIFCDGDFWHGRNWRVLKRSLRAGTNANYWLAKIASNKKRDALNNALLKKSGWRVIRFWETDINGDPVAAAKLIKSIVVSRTRSQMKQASKPFPRRMEHSQ